MKHSKLLTHLYLIGVFVPSVGLAQGPSTEGANPPGGPITSANWRDIFSGESLPGNTGFDSFTTFYLNMLLAVGTIAAVIFIIYYSYLMIASAGSEEQFEKGKKGLLYTVIGIIVILLSAVIAVIARNLALGRIA